MPMYEYKAIPRFHPAGMTDYPPIDEILLTEGAQGWELAAVACIETVFTMGVAEVFYMKRAVTAPSLTSLQPASAPRSDPPLQLDVLGDAFADSSVIVFDGVEMPTTFQSISRLTTTITPPGNPAKTVQVTVRTGGIVSASLPFQFT